MMNEAIERLDSLLRTIPQQLKAIAEADFSEQPGEGKWSRKQVLGHLIDSAANNHQRLVRARYEEVPLIAYDQDAWNRLSHYDRMDSRQLISFWHQYNLHLMHLMRNLHEGEMNNLYRTGTETTATLTYLIEDYVRHMEHHLKQIMSY